MRDSDARRASTAASLDRGMRDSNTLGRDYQYTAASANLRVIW